MKTQPSLTLLLHGGNRPCRLQETLSDAIAQKQLPGFMQALFAASRDAQWAFDCVAALLGDLIRAGRADGWSWVRATITQPVTQDVARHSWLAFDGWVLDIQEDTLHIFDRASYRTLCRVTDETELDVAAALHWLTTEPDPHLM